MSSNEAATDYWSAFGDLAGTYLEDSWVLDVIEQGATVTFLLGLVLTPDHPLFQAPASGEQYCYRRARLTITSPVRSTLRRSEAPPATDASGERDFGNIDEFAPVDWDGLDAWELSGLWGELLTVNPSVRIDLG